MLWTEKLFDVLLLRLLLVTFLGSKMIRAKTQPDEPENDQKTFSGCIPDASDTSQEGVLMYFFIVVSRIEMGV
jgi:hypothetical protein